MQKTRRPPGRPLGFRADGSRLRQLRLERGITMRDLARKIGRNYKTIWRAERDERISEVTAWQIANALTVRGKRVKPQHFMAEWPDGAEPPAQALAS